MVNPGINNIDLYYLRPIPHSVINRDIMRIPTKCVTEDFPITANIH